MRNYHTLAALLLAMALAACGGKSQSSTADQALLAALSGSEARANFAPGQQAITSTDIHNAFNKENDGTFTWNDNLWITSSDGTKIAANTFVPKGGVAGTKYPAIIFVNSWAVNEYEYIVPAAKFAKAGYVVLSYSTRGFGFSGGVINVAGPKDLTDLSSVIDWMAANTPVDMNNVGIAGISYGAGISLIGLSKEPRIKTAAAMSGWVNLGRSLYGNDTPRLVWGLLLITAGYFTGRMDPLIARQFERLLTNTNVADVLAWAADRSALTSINALNAAGKPVYISNNLQDNLFQPNQMLDYFAQLTVPKKLDLNNGIHATAEIGGIIGVNNYVWTNVRDWFDYWLKNKPTGIMSKPAVTIQRKFATDRASFSTWPSPSVVTKTYYLKPRTLFTQGKIATSTNTSSSTNTILSGLDTFATTGIPLLSDIFDGVLEVPVSTSLPLVSRVNGLVYESDTLSSPLKIRGRTWYSGRVSTSLHEGSVAVYLYDEDGWGIGKLLTHGIATVHGATPGAERRITIDLSATVYDVPAGHRIAIALDTYDPQYAPPTLAIYSLDFKHSSGSQNTLLVEAVN